MTPPPVALTVAGSDSGGGAGIQADLKTFEARNVFGTSAITAITAQNTTGVTVSQPLDTGTVRAQIRAVADDFPVGAVKTGMLATPELVRVVADELASLGSGNDQYGPNARGVPLVVDPVMVAESGAQLLANDAVDALRQRLLPHATLVTPNVHEAALLAGVDIQDESDATNAAHELVEAGADAALVTGGHLHGDPVDVLVTDADDSGSSHRVTRFERERVATDATHGSGCTVSAAITAELATGARLPDAVETATVFVTRALRFGHDLGEGAGPVNHLATLRTRADVGRQCRAVHQAVADLSSTDFAPLVPEVGMNVAAAPRFATRPEEVVAVEGRLHRTAAGIRAAGGVAPGASSHVARFLLGIRESDPDVRAACNVRHSTATGAVVRDRFDTVVIDRADEPSDQPGTMDWAAREAMCGRQRSPDAVLDDGAIGKEAMIRVLAASPAELVERLREFTELLELDADVVEPLVVDGEVDEERGE